MSTQLIEISDSEPVDNEIQHSSLEVNEDWEESTDLLTVGRAPAIAWLCFDKSDMITRSGLPHGAGLLGNPRNLNAL